MPSAAIATFHQMALETASICEHLWHKSERDSFLQQVEQIGVAEGLTLPRAVVQAELFVSRREWREHGPITTHAIDLHGWMPIRLSQRQHQHVVEWCYMGQRRLGEPFFEQTVAACLRHPLNMLLRLQTPVAALLDLHASLPGIAPNGFVFHMSRCGSTLVAQALAALPQVIVLAEAEPVDAVLRSQFHDPAPSDEQRIAWLQAMIGVLGRRRNAQEQHVLLKFDSWSVLDLPLIVRAFPNVPWIFLVRDPVEVMVSHEHMRGSQMIPHIIEPALLGFTPSELVGMPLDEYCARTLGAICGAAERFRALGNGRCVPYTALPEVIWSSLLEFFGISHNDADLAQMRRVAQFHAKSPTAMFVGDSSIKQQAATARLRQLAETWVRPTYDQLAEYER